MCSLFLPSNTSQLLCVYQSPGTLQTWISLMSSASVFPSLASTVSCSTFVFFAVEGVCIFFVPLTWILGYITYGACRHVCYMLLFLLHVVNIYVENYESDIGGTPIYICASMNLELSMPSCVAELCGAEDSYFIWTCTGYKYQTKHRPVEDIPIRH